MRGVSGRVQCVEARGWCGWWPRGNEAPSSVRLVGANEFNLVLESAPGSAFFNELLIGIQRLLFDAEIQVYFQVFNMKCLHHKLE